MFAGGCGDVVEGEVVGVVVGVSCDVEGGCGSFDGYA